MAHEWGDNLPWLPEIGETWDGIWLLRELCCLISYGSVCVKSLGTHSHLPPDSNDPLFAACNFSSFMDVLLHSPCGVTANDQQSIVFCQQSRFEQAERSHERKMP
jgi:hypothetical protein